MMTLQPSSPVELLFISVVVPIRNEERFIVNTLEMLVEQDYPRDRFELIVVDGMSEDTTRERINEFSNKFPDVNFRLLQNPKLLSSSARNLGVHAARGKLIAIIDGHVVIPNDKLFANLDRLQRETGAMCFARPAPLLVPDMNEGLPYWIAQARASWMGHSQSSYIYSHFEGFVDPTSSGFAYDRESFSKVGYFDEEFDAAEDLEFNQRLKEVGILAYTSNCLTIYSFPRATLNSLFQQMKRYGIGRARLIRKHPSALSKETLIPLLVFLLFALLPVTAATYQVAAYITWIHLGLLAAYLILTIGTGLASSLRQRRFAPGFLVALAIMTTHLGLGYGLLIETIFPKHLKLAHKAVSK